MDILYTYRCRSCPTVMTTPVERTPDQPPYRCNLCASFMRLLFSEAIVTTDQRLLADRGIVYNPYTSTPIVNTKRQCDECGAWVERDALITLGRFLRFCSSACADLGTEKHRAAMQAQLERLERLYIDQPWLRPQAKETA